MNTSPQVGIHNLDKRKKLSLWDRFNRNWLFKILAWNSMELNPRRIGLFEFGLMSLVVGCWQILKLNMSEKIIIRI